ncbi:MAG TPA: hypothetical protein VII71_06110 [Verrucomicrobiae bacterium]
MKIRTKNSTGYFLFTVALCMMVISGCSCSASKPTPDPLAGWHKSYKEEPNQIITNDYQDYIQKLSSEERKYPGPIEYFEDDTGQHAVRIETDIGGKDCWYHILFYDKDNKRIKVVKYFYGRYIS